MSTQTTTAEYTILGTTDHITTCDHCGRIELKGTVALTRDGSTDVIYMGSTCAARAITKTGRKTSAANVRDEARTMGRYVPGRRRRGAPVRGHGLVGEGAAHNDDGTRRKWNTTGGAGRAMCACGWLSEPAESGAERKRMHRFHKEFIRAEHELAGYPARYVMSYQAVVDEAARRVLTGESAPLNPDAEPSFIIDRGE